MKRYLYKLIYKYISLYCLKSDSLYELNPKNNLIAEFHEELYKSNSVISNDIFKYDFVLLNGNLHYENDIQSYLDQLSKNLNPNSRLLIVYYSSLWKPFLRLATFLGLREKTAEQNWLSHEDVDNFLLLSGLEKVRNDQKIIFPIYIPLLSNLINRFIAPSPFFRIFTLLNITIAKLKINNDNNPYKNMSVSVVVAARNEEGNIESLFHRIPKMGPDDELIIVEGHSRDNTWSKIQELYQANKETKKIKIAQQDGKGKGDAIRKGFSLASKDILMILDADLTVPPEDLPKFYKALIQGKGEYINGSRLVYPMENNAMQFFNLIGNKFFALAFSFVLGQNFKDTLCGTKVLTRKNYEKLSRNRTYFGDFDPFGDFDLIFGSARMGLKIIEVPIAYKERTYGQTNISRWKHGTILLAMLIFAAKKIRFI
jgi:hypothetical protein